MFAIEFSSLLFLFFHIVFRMHKELALAGSEPNFKSLVEGVADVIWSAGVDGALHYLSPQFKTMFGLEPEDWIGRSP